MSWKKKLAAGTLLAGAATVTIHVINKMIYFSATLDNLLSDPSGSYYEWKFGKIYYTKQGEGKPILLIHDLNTCSSSYEWNKVVNELSKSNTVYCLDLLGCGRSDKPCLTYTNFLYVQMITDFIKYVIGEKTNIIATGESGAFTIAACKNDSSIIDQIIMVNPYNLDILSKVPTKRTRIVTWLINIPIIGTFLYNILNKRDNIESLFIKNYFYDTEKIDADILKTYYEAAHSGNSSSRYLFASLKGNYTTINIPLCLQDLNNSIYIIAGKENPFYNEYAKDYKAILPSIEIIDFEEAKYLPQLEEPEDFIEQVNILFSVE